MALTRNRLVDDTLHVLRTAWLRSPACATLFLVVLCTAIFVVMATLSTLRLVSQEDMLALLGLSYQGMFKHWWLFQPITAPLIHGNLQHLLFNMISLWFMGSTIEQELGRRRYILLVCLCAFASMLAFLVLDHGRGHVFLGTSGIVFGILVAQAVMFPDRRVLLYVFSVRMRYAAMILAAVEIYLTIAPDEGGTITHSAHVGGAVVAYLLLLFWRRSRQPRQPRRPSPPPPPSPSPRHQSPPTSTPFPWDTPPPSRPRKGLTGDIPTHLLTITNT